MVFFQKKNKIDKHLICCIVICLFIAILSFVFFIWKGGGAFTLRDDFNTQQLTFPNQVNGFIKKSLPGEWCWNLDIGASFVNGFGFYVLGSPFFWISFLFPRDFLPNIIGWLYITKYVVAGAMGYIYIREMTGEGGWGETFGAILYSFSGYSASALEFFHFHDVVALFPLMLLGLEWLMKQKRKGFLLFSFSIFINCLLNYYFFIGECFFLIIYFIFRFWGDQKQFFKGMAKCLLAAVLGVGMASVLFIPSILYIMGNPRTSSFLSWRTDLFPSFRNFLYLLKGFLLPGEAMNDQSAVIHANWDSTAGWLPLCGYSLVVAHIIRKRDWLTKLLLFLFFIAFSPVLSSGFSLFTRNYQRWWYMLVLIGALTTTIVIKDLDSFPVKAGVFANVLLLLSFYAVVKITGKSGDKLVFHPRRFAFLILISLSGLLIVAFVNHNRRYKYGIIITSVSLFAFITTTYTIHIYRQDTKTTQDILDQYALAAQLEVIDDQYRYELENFNNLLTLTGDIGGVGAFTSTCGNYRFDFNKVFDYTASINSIRKDRYPGLSALFGARYILKKEIEADTIPVRTAQVRDMVWYITEKPACPIGYSVDSYVLREDLMKIDLKHRGIVMLKAVPVNKEDEHFVKDIAQKVDPAKILSEIEIDRVIEKNIDNSVHDFHRDSYGLTCTTDYDKETLVFFSVPDEPGWDLRIDGSVVEHIRVCGLILLKVQGGRHFVEFSYHTPGLKTGVIISVLSWMVFLFLFWRYYTGTVQK